MAFHNGKAPSRNKIVIALNWESKDFSVLSNSVTHCLLQTVYSILGHGMDPDGLYEVQWAIVGKFKAKEWCGLIFAFKTESVISAYDRGANTRLTLPPGTNIKCGF